MVTKMVTNTGPRAAIERHGMARAADFPNTNQHLSGQNKTGRGGHQHISSAVCLGGCKKINLVWPPSCVTVRGPKRWDDRWSGACGANSRNNINRVWANSLSAILFD
jgi:hypothetical protein